MALRTPLPVQPNLYMTDAAGRPLDGGRVYFGEAGKDPELYPIDVFYDELLTIAAVQPVMTKNGFLYANGDTIGIYGTATSYSVKVLDAHGVQVLYLSSMSRLDDFGAVLAAESARAQVAEQELQATVENAVETTQQSVANLETKTADDVSSLQVKDAALQNQINSIGGGKKAYETEALMVADKANIAAHTSIDVTNDPDPAKNGTYTYNGTVFTKSAYDPQAVILSKVVNAFDTKAIMEASGLPDGSFASVRKDPVLANNGDYKKAAGVWSLSDSDPLSIAKTYTASSPTFKVKQLTETDSLDIRSEGDYTLSGVVATALGAPEGLAGVMRVRGENASLVRFYNVFNSNREYISHGNGGSATGDNFAWSTFELKPLTSNIQSIADTAAADAESTAIAYTDAVAYSDKGRIQGTNLDTYLDRGIRVCNTAADATTANNFPWDGVPCVITNYKTSSTQTVLQVATSIEATRKRTASRRYNGTSWGQWNKYETVELAALDSSITKRITSRAEWLYPDDAILSFDTTSRVLSWNRTILCLTSAVTQNRVNFNAGSLDLSGASDYSVVYLDLTLVPTDNSTVTDPTTCIKVGNYNYFKDDIDKIPLVKVRENDGKAVSCSGFLPVVNSSGGGSGVITDSTSPTIAFDKTATELMFYIQGAGSNLIKYQLVRRTNPDTQLDSWGMTTAIEVDADLNNVRAITSNGVWECALKDSENALDHSGGSHGDELRTEAFFFIDGVLTAEDAVISGGAKEIKFVQRSEIFVQDSTTKCADRLVEWTFTFDKLNIKQTVTPVAGRTFTSTWFLMLPVLRKSNTDNTGTQITDREVRSTDWAVLDVSEPDFERREQIANDGDQIMLSGQTSGVSAAIKINHLDSPSPMHFVQNNIQFNKIYVAARTINQSALVADGESWSIDADVLIKTIN